MSSAVPPLYLVFRLFVYSSWIIQGWKMYWQTAHSWQNGPSEKQSNWNCTCHATHLTLTFAICERAEQCVCPLISPWQLAMRSPATVWLHESDRGNRKCDRRGVSFNEELSEVLFGVSIKMGHLLTSEGSQPWQLAALHLRCLWSSSALGSLPCFQEFLCDSERLRAFSDLSPTRSNEIHYKHLHAMQISAMIYL